MNLMLKHSVYKANILIKLDLSIYILWYVPHFMNKTRFHNKLAKTIFYDEK